MGGALDVVGWLTEPSSGFLLPCLAFIMLVERKEFSVYFSPSRAVDSTRRSLPKRRSFISFEKENIFSSFSLLFFLFVVTTEFFKNSTAPCLVWVLLVILPWVSFHHRKLRNYHKFVVPHARHQVLSHLADLHQFIWGKKTNTTKRNFLYQFSRLSDFNGGEWD